jgi:cation diffusion facilitator CzcD-associated flavoprotein CzcO
VAASNLDLLDARSSTFPLPSSGIEPGSEAAVAKRWLEAFDKALTTRNEQGLTALFAEESHWRDLFALTWNISPRDGRPDVVKSLLAAQGMANARGFKIAEGRTPPRRVTRAGEDIVEAIFQFETDIARGFGVLRLKLADLDRAWVISTALHEIKGAEWPVKGNRPEGKHDRLFGGETRAQRRAVEVQFLDRDPEVLIVGGGHNGVSMSVQLRMLGVDNLVVEKLPKVGDVWRNRYGSLALHNKLALNHLPHMKYPDSWPDFLTKDMLGDWIEFYAHALDANVWTSTEFIGAKWDEASKTWSATVRRADGSERVLRVKHVVFANGGIVGTPRRPKVPGLETFAGKVIHSHDYASGAEWRGKNVVIVGVGNTAHDVAQDLHGYGAKVTMIQRGSITVFSVDAVTINHALYYKEGLPLEDCDLIANSTNYPVLLRSFQLNVQKMLTVDAELHKGLRARGFKLDNGPHEAGHQFKIRAQHGGYYLNVGCSDLIVNGDVGLVQYEDMEGFVPEGLKMKDGRLIPADMVVLATGYEPPIEEVGRLLGKDVAEKVGTIWGLDDTDHELRNMYKPTPQEGLWFIAGGFAQGRVWSHYLTLQIKARVAGLVKDPVPRV